jgi:transcriptional regulator with XRE-family HTH domain
MKPREIKPEHLATLKAIGQGIKKLRTEKKIGYIQMAKEIGLSKNAYNSIELGNVYFSIYSLMLIANYHGVSISSLLMEIESDISGL